jgi:predicted transcriptional regulator
VGRVLSATTLVPADFAQMARESELIVRGTVVNVQGQTAGPRRAIESVITVYVTDTLKGTTGTTTVFRVPGGRVGSYRRVMVGAPVFAAGDDVIVFLKGRAPAIAMPYGLSQGVYRVAHQGGGAVVTPAVAAGSGRVVRGDPSRRPLDPAAFAREVQRALGNVVPLSNRRAIPRAR